MDLRQLKYFLAVADHGSFTRAAEALFVSQPALSQQIAVLERELGTPVFDRLSRRVELTSAGRVLREHAELIVRAAENARSAVDDVRGAVRGELVIASIQTASMPFLVSAIARFRARYDGVVVRVREARAHEVVESVRSGAADLGVTYLTDDMPELEVEPLYREELVLVVPPSHPLAVRRLPTRRVSDVPLVVPPGGYCLRQGIDVVLAESGARQRVVAEIPTLEGICAAVRAGVGAAILPARWIVRRARRERLVVVKLVDPVPQRMVGVVRAMDRHACTATRGFLEQMRAIASDSAQRARDDRRTRRA